jgi:hypothetical protein
MAKPDFIDLLFVHSQGHQREESRIRLSDVVNLPAHGEVKAIEGDKIVVSLPGGETGKFLALTDFVVMCQ